MKQTKIMISFIPVITLKQVNNFMVHVFTIDIFSLKLIIIKL